MVEDIEIYKIKDFPNHPFEVKIEKYIPNKVKESGKVEDFIIK